MNEKRIARLVSARVDGMLARAQKSGVDDSCDQELAVARLLSGADYSGQSRVKEPLASRLREEGAPRSHGAQMFRPARRALILAPAALAVVSVAAVCLVAKPPWVLFTTRQSSIRASQVKSSALLSSVSGHQTDVSRWIAELATTAFGAADGPRGRPSFTPVASFAAAERAAPSLLFRPPGSLPDSFVVTSWFVGPQGDGLGVEYANGKGERLVLLERSVPRTLAGFGAPVAGVTRTVTVQGTQAFWVERAPEGALLWTRDGIGFVLGGTGLDLDQAQAVASSITPKGGTQ